MWQKVLTDYGTAEEVMEKWLDEFYYNEDTSHFSKDPRNPSLIGNIDINSDS